MRVTQWEKLLSSVLKMSLSSVAKDLQMANPGSLISGTICRTGDAGGKGVRWPSRGTPVGKWWGWSSYLFGDKMRDLVSFRVSKRFLGHQSLNWYLLGYHFKIITYYLIIIATTASNLLLSFVLARIISG